MTEHLHVIKNDESPSPGEFVMTKTVTDITRSLKMAHDNCGSLTMIAGIPGAGKSWAVGNYYDDNETTRYHSMVAGEGKIWDVAVGLSSMLGLGAPNSRRMREERFRIGQSIGRGRLLVIDEAQYLANYNPRGGFNYDALEWLRAMAEESGLSVAFCGDLRLNDVTQAVPQLRRRILRPVIIRTVPKADVELVAKRHFVDDPVMVNALTAVAQQFGGLADVVNVLVHARRLGGQVVTAKTMQAAIHDLKLSSTRGHQQ